MRQEEVLAKIRQILIEEFSISGDAVLADATLRGNLGMHSLQLVSLAVLLEETYPEIAAASEEFDRYASLATVGEVAAFVVSKLPPEA